MVWDCPQFGNGWAFLLALATAGKSNPARISIIKDAAERHKPTMAITLPPSWPSLLRILFKATMPRITPGMAVMPQVKKPRIPITNDVTAKPLFLSGVRVVGIIGGMAPAARRCGGAARASANSVKDDSGRHSEVPSAWIWLWALRRPSPIHCRNRSALIGPYSFWSAPRIL